MKTLTKVYLLTALLSVFGVEALCQTSSNQKPNETANPAGPTSPAGAQQNGNTVSGLSDNQVEKIVTTSNDVEINLSKLAESKTKNKEVKELARHMVLDHLKWNKEAEALAKKIRTKPEDSRESAMLSSDGKSTEDRLGILNGVEFDRAYVNGEVSFHQSVLDTIDEKLLPNAKNADLQAMLKKTKPEVQAHLEHARKVQSKLSQ